MHEFLVLGTSLPDCAEVVGAGAGIVGNHFLALGKIDAEAVNLAGNIIYFAGLIIRVSG